MLRVRNRLRIGFQSILGYRRYDPSTYLPHYLTPCSLRGDRHESIQSWGSLATFFCSGYGEEYRRAEEKQTTGNGALTLEAHPA